MLTTDPSVPPFELVACCALFLVIVGFLVLPKKKKAEPSWKGTTPAQAYSQMITAIADATEPSQLNAIYAMIQDFRAEFADKIPVDEINKYCSDVLHEKHRRRMELIVEIMDKRKAVVSKV